MSRSDARAKALRRRPSRTVPATLIAVVVTVLGALLAYASVIRLSTDRWPPEVGQAHLWLATHTWGSSWVVAGAVTVLVLGVALLWSALWPGRPTAFPLSGPGDTGAQVGATDLVMSRPAVAVLSGAAAAGIDGVRSTRVTVGARSVRLRVTTPSAQRDEVQRDVAHQVGSALTAAGLNPAPRVTVDARTVAP